MMRNCPTKLARLYFLLLSILLPLSYTFAQNPQVQVKQLEPGVYVHTSFGEFKGAKVPSNGLIIDTSEGVVLIDTAWGDEQTEQLANWVKKSLKKPILFCIITHAHNDRMGGIRTLQNQKVKVWSTVLTSKAAFEKGLGNPSPVLPATDTTITIGNKQLEVYFPGAGHAPDNVVVWLPKEQLFFGGCFVKDAEAQNLGNIADADLKSWPEAIKRVQQRYPDIKTVVPGHGLPSDSTALSHTLDLLQKHQ